MSLLGGALGGAAVTIAINAKDNFSGTFGKASAGLSKMAIGAGVAVAAIGAVSVGLGKVGMSALNAASDFEEIQGKFDVVFSGMNAQAEATAQNLAENFGLSKASAKELLGTTGDLLTGFGFTTESALDLSTQVNELAVDLASFTNYSGGAEGASAALTKALLGERESLKTLGVAILEADIKQRAYEKGMLELSDSGKGFTGTLDRQQKALITLELAMEQSKNAIGDFERTQDSLANQTRIMKGEFENLKVELGEGLIPIGKQFVGVLVNEVMPAVKPLIPKFIELAQTALTPIIEKLPEITKKAVALAGKIFDLFQAVAPLIPTIIDLGLAMITVATNAFEFWIPIIENVIKVLKPLLDLIGWLVEGYNKLTEAAFGYGKTLEEELEPKLKLINKEEEERDKKSSSSSSSVKVPSLKKDTIYLNPSKGQTINLNVDKIYGADEDEIADRVVRILGPTIVL